MKKELATRIATDPLHFLSTTCPIKDKIRIFKASVLSTLRLFEKNASHSQHLVMLLLDVLADTPSPVIVVNQAKSKKEENDRPDEEKVKLRNQPRKQMTPRKIKQPSPSVKSKEHPEDDMLTDEVIDILQEMVSQPLIVDAKSQYDEAPQGSLINSTDNNAPQDAPLQQDVLEKSKRKRKKKGSSLQFSESSVKAAAACNNVTPAETSESTWEIYWSKVADVAHNETYQEWMLLPPSHFKIKCSSKRVCDCKSCIISIVLSPVTECSSVGCCREDNFEPHTTADFDLNLMHCSTQEDCLTKTIPNMFCRDIMPSYFYVATHNKHAKKSRPIKYLSDRLTRLVDYIDVNVARIVGK